MSEQAAKDAGLDVVTSKHRYIGNGRALIVGEPDGMVKIIAETSGRRHRPARSSACTWSGPWVTEQLGQGYLAVNWEATVDEVAAVHPAPSDAERAVRRERARPHRPVAARLTPEEIDRMADIEMPQLGETVTEGTITKWFKQVGDQVAEDEVLFEVSTDKVDSEVPSPGGRLPGRDQGARGRDRRRGHRAGRGQRRARRPAAPPPAAAPPAEPAAGRAGPPPAAAAAGRRAGSAAAAAARRRRPAPPPPPPPPRPRRRPPRRRRRGQGAVAGRAPADRRARPRRRSPSRGTGRRAAASPAATCSGPSTAGARRRPGARRAAAPPRRLRAPARPRRLPAPRSGTGDTVEPLNNIRRITGEHMVQSKATSPHAMTAVEVDYEAVERVRRAHRDDVQGRPRASASPTCRSSPGR